MQHDTQRSEAGRAETTIDPQWLVRALIWTTVGIIVVTLVARAAQLRSPSSLTDGVVRVVDPNREQSLTTYFSALLMLAAALVLGHLAASVRPQDRGSARYWAVLAIIFVLLSCSEIGSWHEQVGKPVRDALGIVDGPLYYAWVVPAAALLVVFVAVYVPFLLRLPRATALRLLLAGALFVGGAIGAELPGAARSSTQGTGDYAYAMWTSLEEGLELLGLSVFLCALLAYLPAVGADRRLLRISSPSGPDSSPNRGAADSPRPTTGDVPG